MSGPLTMKPEYGNWVSARLLYVLGGLGVLLFGLSLVIHILAVAAAGLFLCFAYFAYARYKFSPRGGNIQARLQDLILDHLDWNGEGKALDIGCGNGPLTIQIAKQYPRAEVSGLDPWGGAWEYSKGICERNAEIEQVAKRVTFQKGSAAKLPFGDESYDVIVSNLVFHEVRDLRNKRDAIKEALRVVKKGGRFVFQDLFLWKRVYGDIDDLLEMIRSWGAERVEFVDTSNSGFIPRALKLPFMVGTIGILHGRK